VKTNAAAAKKTGPQTKARKKLKSNIF